MLFFRQIRPRRLLHKCNHPTGKHYPNGQTIISTHADLQDNKGKQASSLKGLEGHVDLNLSFSRHEKVGFLIEFT